MKSDGTKYVPGYDLFKLIVAIILTIILILLLLAEKQNRFEELSLMLAATQRVALPTMTAQPSSTPLPTSRVEPTSTTSAPTVTLEPTAVPVEPTPTVVVAATPPTPEPTPTESVAASDPNGCPSNPTQIQVNNKVIVNDWLNFRTGPGLHNEIQRTNRPGTEMEVIGGPVCTVIGGDPPRGYLWWNVRMEDGREGWSAEAPLNFPNYFLEPNP
ncbi:MAG: hypothetical protein H7Y59_00820 [Anaerolineales bacterium]|nr:hypothetical protein [Anaerolineales bacterium]